MKWPAVALVCGLSLAQLVRSTKGLSANDNAQHIIITDDKYLYEYLYEVYGADPEELQILHGSTGDMANLMQSEGTPKDHLERYTGRSTVGVQTDRMEADEQVSVLYGPPQPKVKKCLSSVIEWDREWQTVDAESPAELLNEIGKLTQIHRNPDGHISSWGSIRMGIINDAKAAEVGLDGGCPVLTLDGFAGTADPASALWYSFVERFVLSYRPVIIKGAAKEWTAMSKWTKNYFAEHLGSREMMVKASPDGIFEGPEPLHMWNDAGEDALKIPDYVREQLSVDDLVIVRPADHRISVSDFLNHRDPSVSFYLEYTGLKEAFPELLDDVGDFGLLDKNFNVTMTNLWFANGPTVGKMHFDAYENLLTQVTGTKLVHLIDAWHNEELYEGHVREAKVRLTRDAKSGQYMFHRDILPQNTAMVMTPADMTKSEEASRRFPLFEKALERMITCKIEAGDVLYVPAFYWHEIESSPNQDGINLAVNKWYDPVWEKEYPCASCEPYLGRAARSYYESYMTSIEDRDKGKDKHSPTDENLQWSA
eukprot:Clim_evm8s203 gene=Clim_evmTU8s203